MADPLLPDFSTAKLLAALSGSLVSLRFVQGTFAERIAMAVGGCALSYYGTTPASSWVGVHDAEGLVGFLIGLFGMAIMAKIYEIIAVADASQMGKDIWESIKRKWNA